MLVLAMNFPRFSRAVFVPARSAALGTAGGVQS